MISNIIIYRDRNKNIKGYGMRIVTPTTAEDAVIHDERFVPSRIYQHILYVTSLRMRMARRILIFM